MKKNFLALLLAGVTSISNAATLKVYPVAVDTEAPRATINIVNAGGEPVTLEAAGIRVQADVEVGVYPPVATLAPGAKQVFRLVFPPMGGNSTQHWRVRISELQAKQIDEHAPGQVRNEVGFDIPVFRNAPGAKAELVQVGDAIQNAGNRQLLVTKIGGAVAHQWVLPGMSFKGRGPVFSGEVEIPVR